MNDMKQTELEWLHSDVREIRRILDTHQDVFRPLAEEEDPNAGAKYLVVGDLTFQIWGHVVAVEVLLREELYSSAFLILRAIFESLGNLVYLVRHEVFQDEAVIYIAFTYINDIAQYPTSAVMKERAAILDLMPVQLVETARLRSRKHPKTWSGKSVKQLAETVGLMGYETFYRAASSEVHGTAFGRHFRVRADSKEGAIKIGREMSTMEVESSANFARRSLHNAFHAFWKVFDGPKIKLRSTNPEEWRRDPPTLAT